jgi:hypothetical protein
MALTLENVNLVKQRSRWDIKKPGVSEVFRAFWQHLEQLQNPDLQLVPLDYFGRADQVIADVPCKLYALYLKKPAASTTASWVKVSDHAATAAAAGDIVVPLVAAAAAVKETAIVFPDGINMAVGAATAQHTAVDGNTDAATGDACTGFAIVGAY